MTKNLTFIKKILKDFKKLKKELKPKREIFNRIWEKVAKIQSEEQQWDKIMKIWREKYQLDIHPKEYKLDFHKIAPIEGDYDNADEK